MIKQIIVALGFLLALSVKPAHATTAYHVTDIEQAKLSSAVVVARIGVSKTQKHTTYQSIMTTTEIFVDEVLYGAAPSTLHIQQMGGTLNGKTLYLPGDARFKVGEKCVLFLYEKNGRWFLTALEQSKYRLISQNRLGLVMERNLSEGIVTRDTNGKLVPYQKPQQAPIKRLVEFRKQLHTLQKGAVK